jgi:hypothetical protein
MFSVMSALSLMAAMTVPLTVPCHGKTLELLPQSRQQMDEDQKDGEAGSKRQPCRGKCDMVRRGLTKPESHRRLGV